MCKIHSWRGFIGYLVIAALILYAFIPYGYVIGAIAACLTVITCGLFVFVLSVFFNSLFDSYTKGD